MPTIHYCKFAETDRNFSYGEYEKGSYELVWDVAVDTANLAGPYVMELARNVVVSATTPNPVAKYGDTYKFADFEDGGSFARQFSGKLKNKDDPFIWEFTANYTPPEPSETTSIAQDPNPLNHGVEYWIEWIEEQVPIERAYCYTRMDHIKRGPRFLPGNTYSNPVREPGHIVNACGQQTIDPQMRTIIHPIVCAQYNAPTHFDAIYLNRTFCETVNGDGDQDVDAFKNLPLFFGDYPRTWRYLMAVAERRQQVTLKNPFAVNPADRNVVVSFYPTIVKVEFRQLTWSLEVVNNGMVTFKYRENDDPQANFGYAQNYLLRKGDNADGSLPPGQATHSTKLLTAPVQVYAEPGSTTKVAASEPQLLNLDGVQIDPDWSNPPQPTFIDYRYLTEVRYGGTGGIIIPWRAGLTPGNTGFPAQIPLFA